MAAPQHVYVVSNATYIPGSGPNPLVTIVGTVDNVPSTGPIPVTIQVPLQSIIDTNTAGGIAAVKNFLSPLLLAAAIAFSPSSFSTQAPAQLPTGTWTQ